MLRWRPPSRSWLCRPPPALGCRSRSACSARTLHCPPSLRSPLSPFVAHVSPQPIYLSLAQSVVFKQHILHRFGVPGSLPKPPQDSVLLEALRPREAAYAHPLGQKRQGFQDVLHRSVLAIKERSARSGEGGCAALASVTLDALLALTELDEVALIHLGVMAALLIGAKGARRSQPLLLLHPLHRTSRSLIGNILRPSYQLCLGRLPLRRLWKKSWSSAAAFSWRRPPSTIR